MNKMKNISKLGIAVVVIMITALLISGFLYVFSEYTLRSTN